MNKRFKVSTSFVIFAILAVAALAFAFSNSGVEASGPALRSLSVTSTPASGDTYHWGEYVEVTLVFSEKIIVDELLPGPRVYLDNDRGYYSLYEGGNSSTTLVYRYSVTVDAWDNDGLEILAGTITVQDMAIGGDTYTIDTPALGAQADHKVDGSVGAP